MTDTHCINQSSHCGASLSLLAFALESRLPREPRLRRPAAGSGIDEEEADAELLGAESVLLAGPPSAAGRDCFDIGSLEQGIDVGLGITGIAFGVDPEICGGGVTLPRLAAAGVSSPGSPPSRLTGRGNGARTIGGGGNCSRM